MLCRPHLIPRAVYGHGHAYWPHEIGPEQMLADCRRKIAEDRQFLKDGHYAGNVSRLKARLQAERALKMMENHNG